MTFGLPISVSKEFSHGSRLQNPLHYKAPVNDLKVSGVDYS